MSLIILDFFDFDCWCGETRFGWGDVGKNVGVETADFCECWGCWGFPACYILSGAGGMKLDERAIADAIIAELMRQSETTGCATETNGRYAQVDGSFDVDLLAAAIVHQIERQLDEVEDPSSIRLPPTPLEGLD